MKSTRSTPRGTRALAGASVLFSLSAVAACSQGAGDTADVASTREAIDSGEWNVSGSQIASPGTALTVVVSTNFSTRQDALVDLLDATGWYASARATVEAGRQWTVLSLQLPESVRDPASAHLSAKILPVGASWEKFLDQKEVPLEWPVGTPIAACLYYGGTLKSWSLPFRSPVGNHGSSTVEVGLAADTDPLRVGPFQGSYAIQSFADTYGIFKTNFGLNLQTGEVYKTSIEANAPPPRISTVRAAPPERKGDLAAYLDILDGLTQAVHYNATFQQGVEWAVLREDDAYLHAAAASLYARFGETLRFADGSSSASLRVMAGSPAAVSVAYGAAAPRDVLVDLLVDGAWVTGVRTAVQEGSGVAAPAVPIPASLSPMTRGVVYVKIVPSGAPWTSKLAEISMPVTVIGPDHFDWMTTEGPTGVLRAGVTLAVGGSFSARQVMDVRADLVDASGKWLAGAQVTSTLAYAGTPNSYDFSVHVPAPAGVHPGDRVTLYTKLIPKGGAWTDAVDEEAQVLTVE